MSGRKKYSGGAHRVEHGSVIALCQLQGFFIHPQILHLDSVLATHLITQVSLIDLFHPLRFLNPG